MYFSDKLRVIKDEEKAQKEINELDCELLIISPVEEGSAPIGLLDVFMAPKGVSSVRRSKEIMVELRE